jgi:general secretion pathway protein J
MRARGFTLIEVTIAVAILALIGVVTYGTFARAMEARDQASRITTHYHQVRQAMLRMSHELEMAFLTRHKDCDDPRTDTKFVSSNAGSGMRLDFTSFSHMKMQADANESDQNELSYYVGRDPDGGNEQALIRREQKRIDEESDEGGGEDALAHGVNSLSFEFYDPKQDRWEDSWDSTSSDYKGRVPLFVRIELKVKDPTGKEETFVTKTRIFLQQAMYIPGGGFAPCMD